MDIEARSRRNNLIVYGLSERNTRDCKDLLYSFLEYEMHMDKSNIVIERAHRLGRARRRHSPEFDPKRPLIAKFRDYTLTDNVFENIYKFAGTRFGVDRDYPA